MTPDFRVFWQFFDVWIHRTLKSWTKPATALLIAGGIADLKRKRADLILENALLRQQLIVLSRHVKRLQLTNGDRLRMVLLARCTGFWKQASILYNQIPSLVGIGTCSRSIGDGSQNPKRRNLE